jgi:hypothetical protein
LLYYLDSKEVLGRFVEVTHSLFEHGVASMNYRLLLEKYHRSKRDFIPQVLIRIRSIKGESHLLQAAWTTKVRERYQSLPQGGHVLVSLHTTTSQQTTIEHTEAAQITVAAYLVTTPHSKSPPEVLEYPPLACLPFPFSSKSLMTPRFISSLLQLWRLSASPKTGLTCTLSDSIVLVGELGEWCS